MKALEEKNKLTNDYLEKMDEYFRAVNYISACQLYLLDNPLLKRPLKIEDIKKKIVGHWGTVPGQNFVYVHLNRVIKRYDLDMILISGPGHGGNFFISNAYLEGTYTETYPEITEDENGLKKLFKQFSFPGGVSSHVAPQVPGSIHEGGELGYSLFHGFGAVFDNPDLIASVIVGDGEAETAPLATSWQGNKFLNPITDGAVLPILHLNGYKINNPTVLSRMSKTELTKYFESQGWKPYFVEGDVPMDMHKKMALTLNKVIEEIKFIQLNARINNDNRRPVWPMIVLRTPKGWTGPKMVDGEMVENSFRAHQVPIDSIGENDHLNLLEQWLKSYRPEELFDENGRLVESLQALHPTGDRRISANPHSNGGKVLKELDIPDYADFAVSVKKHGDTKAQDMLELGKFMAEIIRLNPDNYRLFSPDAMKSTRLYKTFDVTNKVFEMNILPTDDHLAPQGRVMDAFLSEHACEGWLEGYLLTGRHGTFISYEAFVRVVDSMVSQHAKWLKLCNQIGWREDISSLNLLLSSNVWQQDHNGYTHQDPGMLDHIANKHPDIVRTYLPPDTNCLLSCYDHCIRSKNYINVIVASKHPSFQWLNIDEAREHCAKGLGEWKWASNYKKKIDIVLACCGDMPTLECLASVSILRKYLPDLHIKFVNVVDLMKLNSRENHPHGMLDKEFDDLFTTNVPVLFVYHGYPTLVRELVYGRTNKDIDVIGYKEEGEITTPFDMRVINGVDRYHIVKKILQKIPSNSKTQSLENEMDRLLNKHHNYIRKYGVDMPEVANWKWKE